MIAGDEQGFQGSNISGRIPKRELAEARIAQAGHGCLVLISTPYSVHYALIYMQVTMGVWVVVRTPYQGLASDLRSFGVFQNGRDEMHTGPCE